MSVLCTTAMVIYVCATQADVSTSVVTVQSLASEQPAFSLFVWKVPEPRGQFPASPWRGEGPGVIQPRAATEFGARLRLTEGATAYVKMLKFRTSIPQAMRGIESSSQTMLQRPRAKALTTGIKFSF